MKLLFLDLETTGLDPKKNSVVQLSGVIEIDGKVVDSFNLDCAPFAEDHINDKALKVTGKTKEQILDYPQPRTVFKSFVKILNRHVDKFDKQDKFYMVGQNIKFDYDFLNEWFKKNGNDHMYGLIFFHLIDLIALATAFKLAGKINPKDMKLKTIADEFDIVFKQHDAMDDIRATWAIFHKCIDMIKGSSDDTSIEHKDAERVQEV